MALSGVQADLERGIPVASEQLEMQERSGNHHHQEQDEPNQHLERPGHDRDTANSPFSMPPSSQQTLDSDADDTNLLAGPPSLDYTMRTRKLSILIFWSLIIIDSIGIPIGLYFGLWYGTNLSPNAVFSISTGCLGGISIYEYVLRFWRLWRKGSTCRVLDARRWYLDWFHWNYSAAWFFIMVELIVGTVFTNPPIRLLAMPVSSLLFWFAFQLLLEDSLRLLGYRSPIRISSMPKGSLFRPGIYSIIEDVVAVDGSGGTRYRKRLNDRYEASHYFRQMLHRLTLFWAIGSAFAATLTTILVFTLDRNPAYVVGWTLPFVWAGIWTLATFWYVNRSLRFERAEWERVVRAEGVKGVKKWHTAEAKIRLRSVAEGANL